MNQKTINIWHRRFLQQARWTSELRQYFFNQTNLTDTLPILEIGCGTGAVLREYSANYNCFGIDINFPFLKTAKGNSSKIIPVCGNGYSLPFKSKSFSVAYCHFLMLWIEKPEVIVSEMIRVTARGGSIALFAEPDYTSEENDQAEIKSLRKIQSDALIQEGANPFIGPDIAKLLNIMPLKHIQSGKYEYLRTPVAKLDLSLERTIFNKDYRITNHSNQKLIQVFKKLSKTDRMPYLTNTYYAFGQVDL